MSQATGLKREQLEWVPIADVLHAYPWVREFSSHPGTLWGDVLLREQSIRGLAMVRTSDVTEFITTVRVMARATKQTLH